MAKVLYFLKLISTFASEMTGLYIHIPFCASRCVYCGFYSTTLPALRDAYVDALCQELTLRAEELPADEAITTIYLGGGTPSQLTTDQLDRLFSYIYKVYRSQPVEVTMECNPDDITPAFADWIAQSPIDRISMGAQTFSDDRLRLLRRRHTAAEVRRATTLLRQAGICNISIDLMFGFPGETLADWEQDIDEALRLGVEHISAYSLMYEEGTTLHRWLSEGRIQEIDDDLSLRMYDCLVDRLTAAGYRHYEISNFALPQRESRHNSSYWRDVPYMGLGASAHSFDGRQRSWNVADIETYIAAIGRGERPCTVEALDLDTHYEDVVLTSLRTAEGIDLGKIRRDFGSQRLDFLLAAADQDLRQGYLVRDDDHLRLTRRGIYLSDGITARLFV
jgi:putative oxygen-independent coproporphyrinogen III oxidase